MSDTTQPARGLAWSFWGIACLVFGGIGYAGLGRESAIYSLGLLGCGAMMLIGGVIQRLSPGEPS